MVTEPTRIQMRGSLITKSLIDVILTNHPELFENCGVHDPALSDHGLVYGFLNETVKYQKVKIVTFKSLKDFDVEKYKEDLMYAPWHVSEIFNSCDDNRAANNGRSTDNVRSKIDLVRANP